MEEFGNQSSDAHSSDNGINGPEQRLRTGHQSPKPQCSFSSSAHGTPGDMDPDGSQEDGAEEKVEGEEDFITPQTFHRLTNQITRELAALNEEVINMIVRCQLLETDLVVQLSPYMSAAMEEAEQAARESQQSMAKVDQSGVLTD